MAAGIFIASFTSPAALAQGESSLSIDRVAVGIGGAYKVGHWTAISIDITTAEPGPVEMMVEAPDPDGNWVGLPAVRRELPVAGKHHFETLFKVGQLRNALRVEVRDSHGKTFQWSSQGENVELPAPVRQTAFFVATLGHPSGWRQLHEESEAEFVGSTSKKPSQTGFRLIELDSFEALPTDIAAYQSLDLLVISGRYDIDAKRSDVLRQWVRLGGHLIVSVGKDPAGFQSSVLQSWIPVSVAGGLSVREVGGLEGFAGRGTRLLQAAGSTIPTAKLEVRDGVILAAGLDAPFVVRSAVGAGRVTMVAVDLNTPPVSNWSSADALGRRLTGDITNAVQGRAADSTTQLARSGVTEIASQLYQTLDGFSAVSRSSTWTVMGLLLLYLALIGPVDYFVVYRLLKRPQLTWLTLPLFVGLSLWFTLWDGRATNGTELRANQLEVVDIDAASNTATLTAYAAVYSPEMRRYHVDLLPTSSLAADAEAGKFPFQSTHTRRASWHGVPEDRFGGMYREGGIELGRTSYSLSADGMGLANVPIPIWSVKSLDAVWQGDMPSPVESELTSRGAGRLSGTLRHHFRGELKDWVLAHGRQVYRPVATTRNPRAALAPRQSWSVADASPRELSGYLTGTVQQYVESKESKELQLVREQVLYDKTSRDDGYILKILTFYREAGGLNYTGLDNHALRSFDLSPLLELNRAVLYGRIDSPASTLRVDGKPVEQGSHSTFVRVVLPVRDLRISNESPKVETGAADNASGSAASQKAGDKADKK